MFLLHIDWGGASVYMHTQFNLDAIITLGHPTLHFVLLKNIQRAIITCIVTIIGTIRLFLDKLYTSGCR